jgi:rubrerythrin
MRQLLLQCIEIEETIGKIYRKLAEGPAGDGALRALLFGLANDEDSHANQLRLASRLLTENIFAGANIPRQRVAESLQQARDFLRHVQTAPLDLKTTIALAMRLEKDFADVHAHCAVDFADAKMAELFRSLAADDKRHAQAMNQFVKERMARG